MNKKNKVACILFAISLANKCFSEFQVIIIVVLV